ncbi:pimeloyl-ACP methyl ester carboxylesterase [Roseiarcus fermentans]|uniref:Pimeloyl-ACP methyl ester carboxylesterase n=1 Tax=Roseiarcus fermentans TaxID=1473586 RepID=A0A366EI61_9HYPH|nr:alpha/beta hydrolase [Roseiarcus fermentans]RBP02102.1 pimeloyl-ACP methyl ester carboxylesterase [Roseiarcus fermentans]
MHGPGRALGAGLLAALALAASARAGAPSYGPELQGFDYPFPVRDFAFSSQGEALTMRSMDVAPSAPANGRTAVLLHGKNFCAATWEDTIRALSSAGWRVVAPDQIGFCKSTKPERYQYSFQQLAANTHALLASLGVKNPVLVGHSTGGMIAARYALMYPGETGALVLVNPIGLEDWKALGVPPLSVDQWIEREKATTADRIKAYEQATYYAGQWRPEYDRWVAMLAGLMQGPGQETVARNLGLIDDMIYTQPVVYEFPLIKVPTLLMIGDRDVTAIGKDVAPPAVRARLGHYPELAQTTKAAIPGAQLIEFPDAGHAPQIQDPARFNAALIDALARLGQ